MRTCHLLALASVGTFVAACHIGRNDSGQHLDASGIVVTADGAPARNVAIESYTVYFHVAGFEIERRFQDDGDGARGIHTDEEGLFFVSGRDLALSYDWEQDEWVCEDVCVAWETTCAPVTEEVCVQHCEPVTYDECWDECWEECTPYCYDETVCDDYGCWTETVCEEECTTSCETVCGTVTEDECWDECWDETYEECTDVCLESVEECGWVTRVYTEHPALSEVIETRTEIRLRDESGNVEIVPGETIEARQAEDCSGDRCELLDVWVQRDRFVLP